MKEMLWQEPLPREYSPELLRLVNGNKVIASALAARGYDSVQKAVAFIDSTHWRLSDPNDLPDLDKAAERIIMAIRKAERLAVWGDFDVDGQTSTAILAGGLRLLGADVIHHIPIRAVESHGVHIPGLRDLIHLGANLVVTCDTGVGDHAAADFCSETGIDLIITDHHSLPETLPAALAVVNPRRLPAGHPAASLSGAGCAWFVLHEVSRRLGRPEVADSQMDLAALGLVADLVELTGDSRWLVQKGLALIRSGRRPALAAIAATAGLNLEQATEEHISFIIAPRLNALGRLGDANQLVDFFASEDPVETGVVAARLDGLNLRRKLLTDQVYAAAVDQVEAGRLDRDRVVLVLHHPHWPAGVLGIAASRLVETYHLPAILLSSADDGQARGSARSVDGLNITAAIAAGAHLLTGFGGHPMAAGLSLPAENIPAFWREIERAVRSGEAGRPAPFILPLDANLTLPDVTLEMARQIEILAPFGPGNPPLLFSSANLSINSKRVLGRPGDHLQLTIRDEAGDTRKALWWNGAGKPLPTGAFDLAYHLRAASYMGEPQLQMEWVAWRPSAAALPLSLPNKASRKWFDLRACGDPAVELKEIAAASPLHVWQEGANLSPLAGVDRFQIVPAESLAIWTIPASWNDLTEVLDSANPEEVYLFAVSAEPSRPADLLKRLLGLIQYAVEKYDGCITEEKMAGLTALPESIVQLGVDIILSRSLFTLASRQGNLLKFDKGDGRPINGSQDLEEDFIRAVAEVNAFRKIFQRASLEEIIKNSA